MYIIFNLITFNNTDNKQHNIINNIAIVIIIINVNITKIIIIISGRILMIRKPSEIIHICKREKNVKTEIKTCLLHE